MKAARTGSWKGLNDRDIVFFLSNDEIKKMKNSVMKGPVLNQNFPYNKLGEVSLRLAKPEDKLACGVVGNNGDEFYISISCYDSLKTRGKTGARYDTFGNTIDIVDCDIEKDDYAMLRKDLKI